MAWVLPFAQDLLTEEGWKELLQPEFNKHYFHRLEAFLKTEWQQHQVYPQKEHIFRSVTATMIMCSHVLEAHLLCIRLQS